MCRTIPVACWLDPAWKPKHHRKEREGEGGREGEWVVQDVPNHTNGPASMIQHGIRSIIGKRGRDVPNHTSGPAGMIQHGIRSIIGKRGRDVPNHTSGPASMIQHGIRSIIGKRGREGRRGKAGEAVEGGWSLEDYYGHRRAMDDNGARKRVNPREEKRERELAVAARGLGRP